jgi:hypothetical protein
VNGQKRNLFIPTTSPIDAINDWISGSITLGGFNFISTYWNIEKV